MEGVFWICCLGFFLISPGLTLRLNGFADSIVGPTSLHLLTVVKPKTCKCCVMAVSGTAWAPEAVSEQKLIAANVGTCQITAWFYFLVCCFLKIILRGQS